MAIRKSGAINVLLVEDNPGDARLIQEMLGEQIPIAFTLEHVSRLSDGLERLCAPGIDVILLDLSLPDAHGLDTFHRAASSAPKTPIVVLTGLSDETTALRAMQDGAQDYLVKGQVEPDALARSLRYAIERQRLQGELQQLLAREQSARVRAEQAEERIGDLYARYLNLFEGGADAILVADHRGKFVDANPAASDLLGYSKDELIGMTMDTLCAGGPGWVEENMPDIRVVGRWRREMELRRKDGSHVPVEARIRSVTLPTGTVYWSAMRDISVRRAVERQQREFLAMVTHELRNPLVALKGFAQMLEVAKEYDERAVGVIVSQARHLDRLISDLLDVAHFAAGRLELRPAEVDLVALARACVEQAQALSAHRAICLTGPSGPLVGRWDRDRIEQVFQNLLSNAVKYSPDGRSIEVRIEDRGDAVLVAVEDEGSGIPEEAQPYLFSRFFRTETAKASTAGGLGLGLYITKSLVEAHRGTISVESAPGRGSTFTFTLPYGGPASG